MHQQILRENSLLLCYTVQRQHAELVASKRGNVATAVLRSAGPSRAGKHSNTRIICSWLHMYRLNCIRMDFKLIFCKFIHFCDINAKYAKLHISLGVIPPGVWPRDGRETSSYFTYLYNFTFVWQPVYIVAYCCIFLHVFAYFAYNALLHITHISAYVWQPVHIVAYCCIFLHVFAYFCI